MGILDRTLAAARSLLAPEPAPLQQAVDVVDDPSMMANATRGMAGNLWYSSSAMFNSVTGQGTGRDPSYFNQWAVARPLMRSELYGMGRNGLIVQALSKLPSTATREGWLVNVTDPDVEDKGEVSDTIAAYEQRLGSGQACARSMTKGRQYGDAIVLLGIDDGRMFSEPVDVTAIKTIKWAAVIDSRSFQPIELYQANETSLGKVKRFNITDINGVLEDGLRYGPNSLSFTADQLDVEKNRQGGQLLVHADRVLHFPTADYLPLLETLQDSLGAFFEAMNGIRVGARESSNVVYAVKDWIRKQWSENAALSRLHMAFVDRAKSAWNAWVIDKDNEDVKITSRSLSGLSNLGDPFMIWLSAALAMPVTILWGRSPAGFATGEDERETWHAEVRAFQTNVLGPQLHKLHGYILAAQDGCKLPADTQREIIFSDLSPPDEKTRSELRNDALMEIRQLYKDDVITRAEARAAVATLADDYFRIELGELAVKKPPAPVGLITGGTTLLQAAYPEGVPLDAVRNFLKAVAADYFDDTNIARVVPDRSTPDASNQSAELPATNAGLSPDLEDSSEVDDELELLFSANETPADAKPAQEVAAEIGRGLTAGQIKRRAKEGDFAVYRKIEGLNSRPRPLFSVNEVKQAMLERHTPKPAVDHGPRSLCVAFKLPTELARFVPYKAEDPSAPHVTLLYVPDVDPRDIDAILAELHETFAEIAPFEITHTGAVNYFDTPAGKTARVAYAETQFAGDQQALFDDVAEGVEAFGVAASRHGDYTPHVTLAYLPSADNIYVGAVPQGSWLATQAVVWYGGEEYDAFPLQGETVDSTEHVQDRTSPASSVQTYWVWRTQKDGRVRKAHRRLEGRRYREGDQHPTQGEPGSLPNCRCAKEVFVPDGSTQRAHEAARRASRRALLRNYKRVSAPAIERELAAAAASRDRLALPDEATVKLWLAEHISDARKMPRDRMLLLKQLEDVYPYLKPDASITKVYRGVRNVKRSQVGKLTGMSDAVVDKSWTPDLAIAAKFATTDWSREQPDMDRVGAVLVADADPTQLLLNYALLADLPGVSDRYHDVWEETLRQAILDEKEVLAVAPLHVRTVKIVEMQELAEGQGQEYLVQDTIGESDDS